MTTMRAKFQVGFVQDHFNWAAPGETGTKAMETLTMHAVGKSTAYPEDGADEDNTYAKWSPGANLSINVANPDLWGRFKVGDKFYVDFSPAE